MKALIFINGFNGPDVQYAERLKATGLHVEVIDVMTQDNPFKQYARATPCKVTILDSDQGEFLLRPDVDAVEFLEASLIEDQDKEERNFHGQDNSRLDKHIKMKQEQAVDVLTEELLEGGIL